MAAYPKKRFEVILDNLSTHQKNGKWLARHPLVKFHYTPTRASWLNQVEGWFSILQGQSLAGTSFTSVEPRYRQRIGDARERAPRGGRRFARRLAEGFSSPSRRRSHSPRSSGTAVHGLQIDDVVVLRNPQMQLVARFKTDDLHELGLSLASATDELTE